MFKFASVNSLRSLAVAVSACNLENKDKSNTGSNRLDLSQKNKESIQQKCQQHVNKKMEEVGAPGMVVAVSVNGSTVWANGFGYADVENRVECNKDTVMRVASISKSFTAMAVARLWEDGKLDLDKPIHEYVTSFPEKTCEGVKVQITLRHLLSNLSGIRHYTKKESETFSKLGTGKLKSSDQKSSDQTIEATKVVKEFDQLEYFSKKHYKSVSEALDMFKDDELLHFPGKKFSYSTHGWTLISAILEEVSGREFLPLMQDNFRKLGMTHTFPDLNDQLIYSRSRYYIRKNGQLLNAPYVDNSYKWAGGGFVSTVGDLLKFGNAMMYSYQYNQENNVEPGILTSSTVKKMWSGIVQPERSKQSRSYENESYGMGWYVYPKMEKSGCCPDWRTEIAHTGGAIGASSVLYLRPDSNLICQSGNNSSQDISDHCEVGGISVAIITNMQSVGLTSLARSICNEFSGYCQ